MDATTTPPGEYASGETRTSPDTTATAHAMAPGVPESMGHYRILCRLGEGGMGVVYEAEQENPHRTVALKVIRAGYATSEMLHRFENEAQALGRLQHPGIAQIYEAGTAETPFGWQPYFAMELVHGQNLLAYCDQHKLNAGQRLELVARICDAVQHAHQRGLIHRDLKPANILVDNSGQPRILDFGVARLTDSDAQATRQTDVGQLIGTLAYMSPEQVSGDPEERCAPCSIAPPAALPAGSMESRRSKALLNRRLGRPTGTSAFIRKPSSTWRVRFTWIAPHSVTTIP